MKLLNNFLLISNILNMTNHIWIVIDHPKFHNIKAIQDLLRLSTNISSLGICFKYGCIKDLIEKIFDEFNPYINELKIKTDDLNLMKWIIQRIQNVKNFKFLHYYPIPLIWMELTNWLILNKNIFSVEQNEYSSTISFQSRN